MHHFVPSLIIDNLSKNILQGGFPCASLFVDISGFTNVTETLMQHGQHGAEVLAVVMRMIFTPLVHSVYEQGGFVTNFAGDAVMAVFPASADNQQEAAVRALAAAWQIQQHLDANAQTDSPYGTFQFSAKVGLATGDVQWGTILSPDHERAIYYFKGPAIVESANAEKRAQAGDIIAGDAVIEAIASHATIEKVSDHWRVIRLLSTLPEPQVIETAPPNVEQMVRFYPRFLVEQEISGEFRQVLNLFISLHRTPDHAELDAFMTSVFRAQDKYGGLINRIDFGDKGCHMLMFWGAPISYENDITRALYFIWELQQETQIPLRAGITYRIAHAGAIGSPLAEEYTCYGRGVNLAARYMMAADWHEIWVDKEIARRAERGFSFRALGEKQFKGFADPQPVFLITGYREDLPVLYEDWPFTGRHKELQQLEKAMQPIYEGRFGGVVCIVGEAGLGKSRLMAEFLDPIAAAGKATIFLCQTDEIIRQSLNPFRYFLRHYFDQSSARDEADNQSRFMEILDELLLFVPDSELVAEIERTASILASLVGLYWEDSLYEQLDPALRFENSLIAIKTLLRAESRRQPLVMQLEDAHLLDTDSQAFLSYLTRNMDDFPLLLLMSSRDPLPAEIFAPNIPLEKIHLQELGEESLVDMAYALLDQRPSPALLKLLKERSGGNPFYVEQLLHYLQKNDLLDGIAQSAGGVSQGEIYIPTDVRALLTARLDQLPAPVKDVVQYAAVLGREFEAPILSEMMARNSDLKMSLDTAVTQSIWIALDQVRYLFQHALLRDAAYDMQLHSRLHNLHKLAAQAFENQFRQDLEVRPRYPEIAYHFDKAEERAKAAHYYGEAGEQAKEYFSNIEAISYFSRGLELAADDDLQARYNYLCGRETVFQWLGQRDDQQRDLIELERILDQHPDVYKQADLALRRSSYALVTGDYETAVLMAKESLAFGRRTDQAVIRAKAHHRWGRTLWQQGRAKEAEEHIQKALQLVEGHGLRDVEAMCHYDLGAAYFELAKYDQAIQHVKLAQQAYDFLDDQQGLANCQNALGVISYARADYAGALNHYEEALALCHKIGWRYMEPRFLSNLGNNYFDLGNFDMAKSYHHQSLVICREINNRENEAVNLDTLGLIAHYQGRLIEAIDLYKEALAIHNVIENPKEKGFALTHLGYAFVENGQLDDARLTLEEALKIRKELGAKALAIDTLAGYAYLHLQEDRLEKAKQETEYIVSWIEANGVEGIELPVLVYLICYQVLKAAAKKDSHLSENAQTILNRGQALLQQHALRIQDQELRKQFMENVPFNQMLHAAWLNTQKEIED